VVQEFESCSSWLSNIWIVQKYININVDDIRIKLDAIKQKPKKKVQKYYERLDKLFKKNRFRIQNNVVDS